MSYVDGLARVIDTAGAASYDPSGAAYPPGTTAVYLDGMPATDDPAVVLTAYPGDTPDSRNGWSYPRVQVRVRADTTTAAVQLDAAVYDAIQALGPLQLDDPAGTFLQDCHALQSAAQPLGADDNGRQELSRNYQLTILP